MEPVLIVTHNVLFWHTDSGVHHAWIIRDIKETESLSGEEIAISNAFANHIGEELRDDRSGESSSIKGEALAFHVDHVTFRPDLRIKPSGNLVNAQLVWCLILNSDRGNISAFRGPVYAKLVRPVALPLRPEERGRAGALYTRGQHDVHSCSVPLGTRRAKATLP